MNNRENVNQGDGFLKRDNGRVYLFVESLEGENSKKRQEMNEKFPNLMPFWAVRYYSEGGKCFVEIGDGVRINLTLGAKEWNQIICCIRGYNNCDKKDDKKCSLISLFSLGGEIFREGRGERLYNLIKDGSLPELNERI